MQQALHRERGKAVRESMQGGMRSDGACTCTGRPTWPNRGQRMDSCMSHHRAISYTPCTVRAPMHLEHVDASAHRPRMRRLTGAAQRARAVPDQSDHAEWQLLSCGALGSFLPVHLPASGPGHGSSAGMSHLLANLEPARTLRPHTCPHTCPHTPDRSWRRMRHTRRRAGRLAALTDRLFALS